MATLSIMSYNVLFGHALPLLPKLLKKYKPDVMCLQEFEINVKKIQHIEKNGYYLADYSHSFLKFFKLYGVATFYNPQTMKPKNGEVIQLSRSVYELLLVLLAVNQKRTVLKTQFRHVASKKNIDIYNLHLTMHGTNGVRINQLKQVMHNIEQTNGNKLIVAGDFNYAYKRKVLEHVMREHGLKEATRNLLYTLVFKFLWIFAVPLKPDYIMYKGLKLITTIREKTTQSDHFPIVSRFTI